MSNDEKRLPAKFYRSPTGAEPVRDWLKSLTKADRFSIGDAIRQVEYGWPIGMPTCRPLGSGLYEVRTSLPSRRIARVLFSISDEAMILLHGYIKKTRKTPDQDLKLGRTRQKDWKENQ